MRRAKRGRTTPPRRPESLGPAAMDRPPRRTPHAGIPFIATNKPPTGPVTLHYHETSPRPDRVVTLDGLKLEAAPAAEAEAPAPQAADTPTP